MRSPFYLPLLLALISCSYSPLHKYLESEDFARWEADISRFDSLNRAEFSDENTLLVTGSSSVRLWDSIHRDLAPFQVMQRGYGGAKMSDFCYYAERVIKPHPFKAIVVFVANDITGGAHDKSPEEVFALYLDLVKQIRQRNASTPVFWIEVTPTPSRWEANPKIREASELIREHCNRKDLLYFIDTHRYFLDPAGQPDPAWFREDMLHLNREGYLQWSSIILDALEAEGIKP